uniref:Uncharacterized protein n=1 Tax=Opuntia streptacantha TaxID=393608 RepID=A0A7C8ZNN7_OPUST
MEGETTICSSIFSLDQSINWRLLIGNFQILRSPSLEYFNKVFCWDFVAGGISSDAFVIASLNGCLKFSSVITCVRARLYLEPLRSHWSGIHNKHCCCCSRDSKEPGLFT